MSEVTFKPYQPVLVRESNERKWRAAFFSHKEDGVFCAAGTFWKHCIPYEGNEHLLGTTNNFASPEPESKFGDKVEGGTMFKLFSALKPGHITANSNSSLPVNVNYNKTAIRWYCDAAIERLTLAQLDQLDENPLASKDHLQEGINFIKKLRASI